MSQQTITKCRMYLTIDDEEIFLNKMCQQGWKPTRIILGMWFQFERCEPGAYIARVTTGIDPQGRRASRQRRRQLIEFLTDSGAEIIPETNVDADTRIYAIRKAELGEFEINTDTDALISDYTARRKYHIGWAIFAGVMFLAAVYESIDIYSMYEAAAALNDPMIKYMDIIAVALEVSAAVLLLVCFIALFIPIPTYSRKIKELREKRQYEE